MSPWAWLVALAAVLIGLFVWRYWGGQYSVWDKTWTPPAKGAAPRIALEGSLLVSLGACFLLWYVAARLLAEFRGLKRRAAYGRAGRSFLPALALAPLMAPDVLGQGHSIFSLSGFGLIIGAILWLMTVPFVTLADEAWPGPKRTRRVLALCMVLFLAVFGAIGVLKFYSLHFGYRDSGIFAEALMNTLRGRFLYTNYYHGCNLGDHVYPGLVLLLPAFAAWPSVPTLLICQAAALALGAVPMYLLGSRFLGSRLAGILMALAYLLNPAVEHLNSAHVWGFHEAPLCVPLLLWMFYAVWSGRVGWFFVALALALSIKEDVAVVIIMSGPFLFFGLRRRKLAFAASAIGAVWLFLCLQVISPMFWSAGKYRYLTMRWGGMGNSMTEIAVYALTHPLEMVSLALQRPRLAFMGHLLIPLALTPLGALWALLACLPSLGLLVISSAPRFYSIMGQTTATILPVLFVASVRAIHEEAGRQARTPGLRRVGWLARVSFSEPGNARAVGLALAALVFVFCLVFHTLIGPSPLTVAGKDVFDWYSVVPGPRSAAVSKLKTMIPPSASVAATDKVAAHFITQRDLFVADKAKLNTPDEQELDQAEYVVLDVFLSEDQRHARAVRDRLLKKGSHGLIADESGMLVFRRGAPTWRPKPVKDPVAAEARMMIRPDMDPGPYLRCHGVNVRTVASGRYRLSVLWSLRRKTDDDVFPMLIFAKADGRRAEVGPIWLFNGSYPTYLWPEGAHYLAEMVVDLAFEPKPEDTTLLVRQGQLTFKD